MPRTYYDVLEIPQSASSEDIKKAHRHLAQEFHPDKLIGVPPKVVKLAEEKFKDIQEAYEILTKHRAEYDAQLQAAATPPSPQPNGQGGASAPAPPPPRSSRPKRRRRRSAPSSTVPPASHPAKSNGNIWRGLGKAALWLTGIAIAIFLVVLVVASGKKRSRRS